MREIVLDTETTGLDPVKGDRLVEIGAIEIVNQVATGSTFHVLLNPEREVSEEAFRIHGHSRESLKNSPVFADIAGEFLAFIAKDPLVIHNAEFDVKFINSELLAAGRATIPGERVTDTLALARRRHPGASNSLDALCDRYRIDRSRRIKHGALLDAQILVDVYAELMGGRQKSLALPIQSSATFPAWYPSSRNPRDVRLASRLGKSDIVDHFHYITSLGETAIWLRYADRLPQDS